MKGIAYRTGNYTLGVQHLYRIASSVQPRCKQLFFIFIKFRLCKSNFRSEETRVKFGVLNSDSKRVDRAARLSIPE